MLFPQSPEAFVRRLLVILHVDVPGLRELDELDLLHFLNFAELLLLPLLHFLKLPLHLDFGDLFELVVSNLGLPVFVLSHRPLHDVR